MSSRPCGFSDPDQTKNEGDATSHTAWSKRIQNHFSGEGGSVGAEWASGNLEISASVIAGGSLNADFPVIEKWILVCEPESENRGP
jgi:hypothetical protein